MTTSDGYALDGAAVGNFKVESRLSSTTGSLGVGSGLFFVNNFGLGWVGKSARQVVRAKRQSVFLVSKCWTSLDGLEKGSRLAGV